MKRLFTLILMAGLIIGPVGGSYATIQALKGAATRIHHNIVYLAATPCSAMVEVLRMIAQRGDMLAMHIPGNLAYCHVPRYIDGKTINYLNIVKGWYKDEAPTTYQKTAEVIHQQAALTPVFIGENTHTATEFLTANPDFARQDNVRFVFLIGNPHHLIIDYYNKKKDYFDQLPEAQMANSVGLKDLYEFIKQLTSQHKAVFICESEKLYSAPEATVQALCNYLQVPFMPESLHWKDISVDFTELPFWTIENTECSRTWHMKAIQSTGFTQPPQYAYVIY